MNAVLEMRHPILSRIPRPTNAFILFANEHRKQVAQKYPQESNKDISKRLGVTWKGLDLSEKKKYFELAKTVDAEHKKKYPDYVYNPKEARIRKAMREASREQTLGAAPISSPRGGRRSQHWVAAPEEQLLMTPPPELGSPMCSNPIFPGHPTNVGQFMPSMDAYTKLVHVLPPSGWLQDSPTYIQHNPMAELQQHQSHMWHQYQEPIRSCGDSPYLLDAHQSPYQDAGGTDSLPHKKPKSQTNVSTNSRKSDEVVTIKCNSENGAKQEKVDENNTQMSTDSGNSHRNHSYTNICKETIILQNPFDRDDEMKLTKENIIDALHGNHSSSENNGISFDKNNIRTNTSISQEGVTSNATYESYNKPCMYCELEFSNQINSYSVTFPFSKTLCHNGRHLDILLDNCKSNLICTDVGVIPLYDSDADVDGLLNNIKNTPSTNFNRKTTKM